MLVCPCHSNVISGKIVVGTVVYEVGDVALGNAKCRLEKPFGDVEVMKVHMRFPAAGSLR